MPFLRRTRNRLATLPLPRQNNCTRPPPTHSKRPRASLVQRGTLWLPHLLSQLSPQGRRLCKSLSVSSHGLSCRRLLPSSQNACSSSPPLRFDAQHRPGLHCHVLPSPPSCLSSHGSLVKRTAEPCWGRERHPWSSAFGFQFQQSCWSLTSRGPSKVGPALQSSKVNCLWTQRFCL